MTEQKEDQALLTDQVRFDDLMRAAMMTTLGGQFQSTQLGLHARESVLEHDGYVHLSKIYSTDGLFSAVIDRAAEDAMAAGFEFSEHASLEVVEEFERLELDEVFTDALRFARLHGASLIVPIFKGNARLSSPIGRSRRYEIDYFEVISLDRVTVDSYGPDGMPLILNVTTMVNDPAGGTFKLHMSRCIIVSGRRRPHNQVDSQLIFPGVSEGQRCMRSVLGLSRSFVWAEKALERKSQAIFKMKGLATAMQNKLESLVTSRLNLTDAVRSMLNTVAVDADDDFDVSDTNLASISDTLDSKMQNVAAETGYPITVFFGRRTTSLNSKGDSDTDTYYRMLNKIRRNMLRNPLHEVIALLGNYLDVSVPSGETLVKIAKLDALSDYEEAEIEERRSNSLKARAEAIVSLMGAGASSTTTEEGQAPVSAAPGLLTREEALKLLMYEDKNNG